jgi:23S rRNA pseudouridine1911/1915/1917 synthase
MPRRTPPANSPAGELADQDWTLPSELEGKALDGALRALTGLPWSRARSLIETGKVRVTGELVTSPTREVRRGDKIELRLRTPRPRVARAMELEKSLLVHIDAMLVVVRKPPGISTVPFGEDPDDREVTLDALVRDVLARKDSIRGRAPLGVVQRLDKATSGLLVFSRTLAAKKHLAQQLRVHSMHRVYLAIAHGDVRAATHRSYLVEDRGDRIRGSAPQGVREGQLAITHVRPVESLKGATLIECKLETGRTHQIRIHLSETGHPLVGERVYIRDFKDTQIPAPRLMLHAAELGFEHPLDEREMRFREEPPKDFEETLRRLRR